MKDISRLSWNLENADLRAKEGENGLWIMVQFMEYSRLGPTLSSRTWYLITGMCLTFADEVRV